MHMTDTATIEQFLRADYTSKDVMHGLSHIHRLLADAAELGKYHPHDSEVLALAAYCHGVIYRKEPELRQFLATQSLSSEKIDKVIIAAWESQTDSSPQTIEGKLLHDAHLLEGGRSFIVAKSLVTGTIRGQSIEQTIDFIEEHILGKFKCSLPEAQAAYRLKENYARDFVKDIRENLLKRKEGRT